VPLTDTGASVHTDLGDSVVRFRFTVRIKFSLPKEVRDEVQTHREVLARAESTLIVQDRECVALEQTHVLLGSKSGHELLLSFFLNTAEGAHLKVTAFCFVLFTSVDGFKTLGFKQFALTKLLESLLVLDQRAGFIVFLNFNQALLERPSD